MDTPNCRTGQRWPTSSAGWCNWRTGSGRTRGRGFSPIQSQGKIGRPPQPPAPATPSPCWDWTQALGVPAWPKARRRSPRHFRSSSLGPCRPLRRRMTSDLWSSWRRRPAAARQKQHCGASCTCSGSVRWTASISRCRPEWPRRSCTNGCATSWCGSGRRMHLWSCEPCPATKQRMANRKSACLTTRCSGRISRTTTEPLNAGQPNHPSVSWPPPSQSAQSIRHCSGHCGCGMPTCGKPC